MGPDEGMGKALADAEAEFRKEAIRFSALVLASCPQQGCQCGGSPQTSVTSTGLQIAYEHFIRAHESYEALRLATQPRRKRARAKEAS